MERYEYLAHHGVKGQKWGVRRYQNADGTLTDEGRRRYGYGSSASDTIRPNTAARIKQFAKAGAAVGGVVGTGVGVYSAIMLTPYIGIPASVGYAVGYAFSTTLSTSVKYAAVGSIVGAVETHKGRKYIERYDKGLEDFEKRERSK